MVEEAPSLTRNAQIPVPYSVFPEDVDDEEILENTIELSAPPSSAEIFAPEREPLTLTEAEVQELYEQVRLSLSLSLSLLCLCISL